MEAPSAPTLLLLSLAEDGGSALAFQCSASGIAHPGGAQRQKAYLPSIVKRDRGPPGKNLSTDPLLCQLCHRRAQIHIVSASHDWTLHPALNACVSYLVFLSQNVWQNNLSKERLICSCLTASEGRTWWGSNSRSRSFRGGDSVKQRTAHMKTNPEAERVEQI